MLIQSNNIKRGIPRDASYFVHYIKDQCCF
nr:MAG TPA: hypothetical protein [Caudoviricetes sp.]